jgi:hypothetical protein
MNIGIRGGSNIIELGEEQEIHMFFDELIKFRDDKTRKDKKYQKLELYCINRLYQKYVMEEDLLDTLDLTFMFTRTVILNKNMKHLDILAKIGLGIVKAFHSALYVIKSEHHYNFPVSLIIIDAPYRFFRIGDDVPLEDIDNLEGDPLWMRPDYMLEKYGGGK